MLKIIMNGYNGKMGSVIIDLVKKGKDCEIVAGIDPFPPESGIIFPTYTNIFECDMPADVIIDFSTPQAIDNLLDFAVKTKTPVVLCTTGLSDKTVSAIEKASENVAILRSANMSIGVNLIANLLPKVNEVLKDAGFDIEIIEKHHNQKIDAPSGTALYLADTLNKDNDYTYIYDRSKQLEKRDKNEIGIHAVRGGTIAGEHTVIFAGQDEIIELTHIANSKEIFAVGAVKAAKFLAGKPAGLYDMNDVMK